MISFMIRPNRITLLEQPHRPISFDEKFADSSFLFGNFKISKLIRGSFVDYIYLRHRGNEEANEFYLFQFGNVKENRNEK